MSVFFIEHHLERLHAELCREHSVVSDWHAAALKVTECRLTHIVFKASGFHLLYEFHADAAELHVFISRLVALGEYLRTVFRLRTLADDHDGMTSVVVETLLETRLHDVDIVRELWQQTHLGTASYCSIKRNPTGVATHYFENENTVVRCGCCDKFIDCFCGNLHCCLETEGAVGHREVVVDGLRHADDIQTLLVQFLRDAL